MKKFIPYGHQSISNDDIEKVIEVLKSDFITQGPKVLEFEQNFAKYCKSKYAVAVSNGTAALHLACLSLNLKKEDIIWTSPNTFVASANCGLYCGAKANFVDIDEKTYNLSVDKLEAKLKIAKEKNLLPKILIPVHFAGQSCDMKAIYELGKKYGFKIIEDACHALGGSSHNEKIGSCKFSDLTVFSFHPVKTITTGEGGMITTNSKKIYEKLLMLRNHGTTKDKEKMNKNQGSWYYEMQVLGFNYRMTDIQAALGISQLRRVNSFLRRRRQIAEKYNQAFKNIDWLTIPHEEKYNCSSFHLYVLKFDFEKIDKTKEEVMNFLLGKNIGTQVHYIPVHTQPYYQENFGFRWGDFPNAEKYYEKALSIPIYPDMTDENVEYIIKNILDLKKINE